MTSTRSNYSVWESYLAFVLCVDFTLFFFLYGYTLYAERFNKSLFNYTIIALFYRMDKVNTIEKRKLNCF